MSQFDFSELHFDDIINVEDIIDRVDELRTELSDLIEAVEEADASLAELDEAHPEYKSTLEFAFDMTCAKESFDLSEDRKELDALEVILADLKDNGGDHQWEGDWYPASLIRDTYFETAMDELLEDIGDLPKDLPCYLKITVDYDCLRQDYTSTDISGVTYWYR